MEGDDSDARESPTAAAFGQHEFVVRLSEQLRGTRFRPALRTSTGRSESEPELVLDRDELRHGEVDVLEAVGRRELGADAGRAPRGTTGNEKLIA